MKRFHSYLLLLGVLLVLSCNRVRLSDARNHYVRGEYHEAIAAYRLLYQQTPREERALRGVIAYEMAENYRLLNRSAYAATAYRNAIRYGYPDSDAPLRLAQMLHREGDYAKAIEAYRYYLSLVPDDRVAVAGLQGAEEAMSDQKQREYGSSLYQVEPADLFNSSRSDFSPLLADDDQRLYFTSSREAIPGEERSGVTGTKFHDLYLSERNSRGEWQQPKRIESALNSDLDEGIATVTADGDLMFYSVATEGEDQPGLPGIYLSRRINGIWSAGSRLDLKVGDSLSLFAHPAVSGSGELLYFVSDMPGGMGGKDIWLAHLNSRQEVTQVVNAGASVNTPGNEMFPTLRNDTILYFSSDGHPGRGGLDLFRAVRNSAGDGWHLQHLPTPLNSSGDDFGITFEQTQERGFFSSNRMDARGYDHIYTFELVVPVITVEGFVVDRDDRLLPGAIIDLVGSDGMRQRLVTDREGIYRFRAEEGVAYQLLAQAEGFLTRNGSLPAIRTYNDTVCYLDFVLTPYDRPVILEHIFYDFDRAQLRSESKEELDNLLQLMREHPEIRVELSAHTDRVGSEHYNEVLSLRRARSVVRYLTAAGIAADRLTPVGYGESKPKRVDATLAERYPFLHEGASLTEEYISKLPPAEQAVADQLNRRTEFKVLPSPLITPWKKE